MHLGLVTGLLSHRPEVLCLQLSVHGTPSRAMGPSTSLSKNMSQIERRMDASAWHRPQCAAPASAVISLGALLPDRVP